MLIGSLTRPQLPAAPPVCMCSLGKRCERAHTYRQGRQALAGRGRRSLAALSGSHLRFVFPSRYLSSSVLARLRLSVAVSSLAPLVAALRLSLAAYHWLVAA